MRIVCEMTGVEVTIGGVFTTFIQEGTPTGTMFTHGYLARPTGGTLAASGADGHVSVHRVSDPPPLIPLRAVVRRVLDDYRDLCDLPERRDVDHGDL